MSPGPIAAPLDEQAIVLAEMHVKAQTAMSEGDFNGVVEICREVLKLAQDETAPQNMLAVALHRLGRTEEGLETLQASLDLNPNSPDLYANLGELQRQAGKGSQAIDTLRRALSLDQHYPLIHFNLAMAYFDTGAIADAERCFRSALELDHMFVPAHRELCRALREGSAADGRGQLEFICQRLAGLLYLGKNSSDYGFNLRTNLQDARRAIGFGRSNLNPNCLLVLGKLLLDLKQTGLAIEVLEMGRDLSGAHPDYNVALSMGYASDKQWKKAYAATSKFNRENPIGSRNSVVPGINVLVLEALYNPAFENNYRANAQTRFGSGIYARSGTIADMTPSRMSFHHMYVDEIDPGEQKLKNEYDVIFNNINFAEINLRRKYTKIVNDLQENTSLEIINEQELINRTTRLKNYEVLNQIERIIFPKTSLYEVNFINLDQLMDSILSEFDFPVLVGKTVNKLRVAFFKADNVDQLRDAIKRYDCYSNIPIYVIQFHESRHPCGQFLRYRAMFIDGVLYPGRMYLSQSWRATSVTDPAQAAIVDADNQDQERLWLNHPEEVIGLENVEALHRVNEVLGLDIIGIDFGLSEDGEIIIFEANPGLNLLTMLRHVESAPYLAVAGKRIISGIENLIVRKSNLAVAVR